MVEGVIEVETARAHDADTVAGQPLATTLADSDQKDYLYYSYLVGDQRVPPEGQQAIAKIDAQLRAAGKVNANGQYLVHPQFGPVRYTTLTHNADIPFFPGKVVVVVDRVSYSANTGLLMAMQALAQQLGRNTLIRGEPSEEGSGSDLTDALSNLSVKVSTTGFVNMTADGILAPDTGVAFASERPSGRDVYGEQLLPDDERGRRSGARG